MKMVDSLTKQLTIFTICSKNFIVYAKTLFDSIQQYHLDAEMFLFLCDGVDSEYNLYAKYWWL
jgi:hypothetical protein